MRLVPPAVLPVLPAACGVSTSVNFMIYALDGFSLVSTGRTTTDHMISAAMEKECMVFRVVKDEVMCREF